ncbi:hypothetical protein WJX81_008118 [Elliptochloris bilobata]|uniref:Uncharacterized protein n=1 Tax=Elliptochloris bilobata TaxID=381761 RepID=A0AAW1QNJ7_9CHLO
MVNKVNQRCEADGYDKTASFGFPSGAKRFCKEHALPGMINAALRQMAVRCWQSLVCTAAQKGSAVSTNVLEWCIRLIHTAKQTVV